jgi:hypothetical protein
MGLLAEEGSILEVWPQEQKNWPKDPEKCSNGSNIEQDSLWQGEEKI